MMVQPNGWRKSSYTHHQTACVEVGSLGSGAAVRDSKDRPAGYIAVPGQAWSSFVTAVKTGHYDR